MTKINGVPQDSTFLYSQKAGNFQSVKAFGDIFTEAKANGTKTRTIVDEFNPSVRTTVTENDSTITTRTTAHDGKVYEHIYNKKTGETSDKVISGQKDKTE